jgi:hypothetical protein
MCERLDQRLKCSRSDLERPGSECPVDVSSRGREHAVAVSHGHEAIEQRLGLREVPVAVPAVWTERQFAIGIGPPVLSAAGLKPWNNPLLSIQSAMKSRRRRERFCIPRS